MRRLLPIVTAAGLLGAAALSYGLDRPAGYGARIDFMAVLPPPPATGSPEAVAERKAFAASAAAIGTPRWAEAGDQVFPTAPQVTAQIGCALGRRISPATTPVTARLMANIAADLRQPVEAAKSHFKRDRPFVHADDTRTCDPRTLGSLGGSTGGTLSFSYPSGHAAYGEAWSRALAQAAPDHADALTAWGRRFGDNRVVCRVHWPSDIAAGRRLGAALHARLTANPAFRTDLAAARAELARASAATGCAPAR